MLYVSTLEIVPECETSTDPNLFISSIWKYNSISNCYQDSLEKQNQ